MVHKRSALEQFERLQTYIYTDRLTTVTLLRMRRGLIIIPGGKCSQDLHYCMQMRNRVLGMEICNLDEWEYDKADPEKSVETSGNCSNLLISQFNLLTFLTDVVEIDNGCREREKEREREGERELQ